MMNPLIKSGMLGLAALVTTGLIAWQAPSALADHGSDGSSGSSGHQGKAFKRDDDGQVLVTTVTDDDDDDTGLGPQKRGTHTNTNTHTRTGAGTNTGTRTRGRATDHSRARQVRDLTNDGPGRHHVDHSRQHTNDGTRHNTRG